MRKLFKSVAESSQAAPKPKSREFFQEVEQDLVGRTQSSVILAFLQRSTFLPNREFPNYEREACKALVAGTGRPRRYLGSKY